MVEVVVVVGEVEVADRRSIYVYIRHSEGVGDWVGKSISFLSIVEESYVTISWQCFGWYFSFVLDLLQTFYRIRADIVFPNCVFRLSPSAFFIYDCNQSSVLFSTRTHQINRNVCEDFETSGRLERTSAGRSLHDSLQIVVEVALKSLNESTHLDARA